MKVNLKEFKEIAKLREKEGQILNQAIKQATEVVRTPSVQASFPNSYDVAFDCFYSLSARFEHLIKKQIEQALDVVALVRSQKRLKILENVLFTLP